jgi:hypothetical protein
MGTKQFLGVVCDEHGIGGSGEYCSDDDAHLDRISVLYHEKLGGVIDASNLKAVEIKTFPASIIHKQR